MEWGPDPPCAQESPALLLETDYLEQTYNLVGTALKISHVVGCPGCHMAVHQPYQ